VHLAKVTYAIQTKSIGFNSGVINVIFMALKEQTVLQVYAHEIRMQCPIACMKSLRLRFPAYSSVQRCCRRSWCAFAAFDRLFSCLKSRYQTPDARMLVPDQVLGMVVPCFRAVVRAISAAYCGTGIMHIPHRLILTIIHSPPRGVSR